MILLSRSITRVQKKSIRLFICVIFTCLSCSSFAQSFYSIDPNYLSKTTESASFNSRFTNFYPDTSISGIHRFMPRNYLGNMGLSNPNYMLKFTNAKLGFRLYKEPLDNDRIEKENVEYYRTKGPYGEANAAFGAKQLASLRFLFANTFKNRLNFTLRLNRYSSLGYYNKQQSFTNNFYVSANYETKNKRFGFNTFILANNNKFQENGGVINDTLREKDLLVDKKLVPVRISSATRDNRELTAMYSNWFRLNKNKDGEGRVNTYLQYRSAFSTLKYKYKDVNSGTDNFYRIFYLDTAKTLDSTRVRHFNNELDLSFQSRDKNLTFTFGYENQISQLWQYTDTSFTNHLMNANLAYQKSFVAADSLSSTNFINNINGSYIAAGAFAGNYAIETFHALNFVRNTKLKQSIQLRFLAENRTPDFMYKHWYSNHFIWDNTFNNTQTIQAELAVKIPMLKVSAIYKGLTNYIYFDQLGYPMQKTGTIVNGAVKVRFENVFFKHLGLCLEQTFQNSSSTVIVLPNSVSMGSLYYRGNFFKNNLQLCMGAQAEYYNQFTPYAYMPATQAFYIQDKYQAGNYPFVDVFINARIRPVSFFVKMENVLHPILGTNYSMVPGYYQPELAWRAGLTWMFFD